MVSAFNKKRFYNFFGGHNRKVGLLSILSAVFCSVSAQGIHFSDLMHIATFSRRVEPLVKEFGFMNTGEIYKHDTLVLVYDFVPVPAKEEDSSKPIEKIHKQLLKYRVTGGEYISFTTSLLTEHLALLHELKNNGFVYTEHKNDYLFQKGNVLVNCQSEIVDSDFVYTYYIYIKQLPKASDMVFAEDLFQLSSHEYLATVFGKDNVRKDLFYLPGNKTTQCSVLFPNTKYEAVFVWEDGPNYRNILALRIGGDPRTKSSAGYQRSIEQNVWQSRDGIYIGMGARELKMISERNIVSSGSLKNNRRLEDNYSGKMGLLLGCMNCGDAHYIQADYSSLQEPMDEGQKIYISTMILAGNPSKK